MEDSFTKYINVYKIVVWSFLSLVFLFLTFTTILSTLYLYWSLNGIIFDITTFKYLILISVTGLVISFITWLLVFSQNYISLK